LTINLEFALKVAADAQRDAANAPSPRVKMKAKNLETLFDAKLATIEREATHLVARLSQAAESPELLDFKKVN
jgi:hypothetical protein